VSHPGKVGQGLERSQAKSASAKARDAEGAGFLPVVCSVAGQGRQVAPLWHFLYPESGSLGGEYSRVRSPLLFEGYRTKESNLGYRAFPGAGMAEGTAVEDDSCEARELPGTKMAALAPLAQSAAWPHLELTQARLKRIFS